MLTKVFDADVLPLAEFNIHANAAAIAAAGGSAVAAPLDWSRAIPAQLNVIATTVTGAKAREGAGVGIGAGIAIVNTDELKKKEAKAGGGICCQHNFSYILAADCVYSIGAIPPLVAILQTLLLSSSSGDTTTTTTTTSATAATSTTRPKTTVLWCHKRRHENVDVALKAAWEHAGLTCRVIDMEELHPMHQKAAQIDLYELELGQATC